MKQQRPLLLPCRLMLMMYIQVWRISSDRTV